MYIIIIIIITEYLCVISWILISLSPFTSGRLSELEYSIHHEWFNWLKKVQTPKVDLLSMWSLAVSWFLSTFISMYLDLLFFVFFRPVHLISQCNSCLLVYIRTSPAKCLERVKSRGRTEEVGIPLVRSSSDSIFFVNGRLHKIQGLLCFCWLTVGL